MLSLPVLSHILLRTTAPLLNSFEAPRLNVISTVTRLESAVPKITCVTPLESALPKWLNLKSFRIRTCKKRRGEGVKVLTNFADTQPSRHAELRPSPPRSSQVFGPPQVAAPITRCHNRSFDCTSRLRTPACLEFWRRVTVFPGGS